MPDWISHILIGLIFAEIFSIRKKGLVVFGSLLPDFAVKVHLFGAFFHVSDKLAFVTQLYHSPVMGLIIPGLAVPFFRYDWKKTYLFITSGFMLHLFADSFTRLYHDGILLYPFSYGYFSFGLLWPEQYWIVIIAYLAVYVLIKLAKFSIKKFDLQ